MPNWCMNNLAVYGPEDDVAAFKAVAGGRTHCYKSWNSQGEWPVFDHIRMLAFYDEAPPLGEPSDFSFHALDPVPQEVLKLPYDQKSASKIVEILNLDDKDVISGYNWETTNWGVKWGCTEAELTHSESSCVLYSFQTAWGPPVEFFQTISKEWPTLCFELDWSEPGMAFEGKAVWVDGEMTENESWDMEDKYEE